MKTLEFTLCNDPVFKKYGHFLIGTIANDMRHEAYLLEGFVGQKEDIGKWLP